MNNRRISLKVAGMMLVLLCSAPLFAQEAREGGEFWVQAGAETALYGQWGGAALGGGLSAGYSIRGGAIGVKAAWFGGLVGETALELTLLARFWLGHDPFSGFFYQFQAGVVFFAPGAADLFGAGAEPAGTISFAALGYRLRAGNRFYLEPTLRAGYPYYIGLSLSAGWIVSREQ